MADSRAEKADFDEKLAFCIEHREAARAAGAAWIGRRAAGATRIVPCLCGFAGLLPAVAAECFPGAAAGSSKSSTFLMILVVQAFGGDRLLVVTVGYSGPDPDIFGRLSTLILYYVTPIL